LQPRISIITPVFNPDKKVFFDMLESVVSQTYDNWELCLADASSESHTRRLIEEYKKTYHEKIRVSYLRENRGIAGNANEALSLAEGDYVALLDHDDTLAPFALFEVVKAINEHPEVDFLYSDRDIIYYDDRRAHPFFKPDWSPDYLLAQNYLCHLNVFRKSIMDEVGGFREGYEGSQDYDLLLRVTERTDRIIHIPQILYHWRVVPGSASVDPTAKPYAYDAAIKALQDALKRRGCNGDIAKGVSPGFYDIRFEVRGNPKVSIIVPARESTKSLQRCLDSVLNRTAYKNYQVILLGKQNISEDLYEEYKEMSNILFLGYDEPFQFSKCHNSAISEIETEYVLFLGESMDVVAPDWIDRMLGFAQRKETGAVGGKLLFPSGEICSIGLIIDEKGRVLASHRGHPRDDHGYNGRIQNVNNVSAVSGMCMMVRRELLDVVGGFDLRFHYYGDVDFCFKLRERGLLIVYEPHVELYCHENPDGDMLKRLPQAEEEREVFRKKWAHLLGTGDPYHSPHLTWDNGVSSIRI
jgi:GT2 family glycosyltransferase